MPDFAWAASDLAWSKGKSLGSHRFRDPFPGECEAVFGRLRVNHVLPGTNEDGSHTHELAPVDRVLVVFMKIDGTKRCVRWPVATGKDGTWLVPIKSKYKRRELLARRPADPEDSFVNLITGLSLILDENLNGPPCSGCLTEARAKGEL